MRRQPRLLASLDVLDLEGAAIGDDIDGRDIENGAGGLGGSRQKAHVDDLIGHGLRDEQFVLRVDRHLNVGADGHPRVRRHRPESGSVSDIWASPLRSRSANNAPY
ncbi:MAG: hypothetical protein ACREC4_06160 [Methylocella sp.]